MDKAIYQNTQQQIIMLAGLVDGMPLAEFIQDAERVDALAPILDPSLWVRGHSNLDQIVRMAKALQEFQAACAKAIPALREHFIPPEDETIPLCWWDGDCFVIEKT